jgi:hypothetical protein
MLSSIWHYLISSPPKKDRIWKMNPLCVPEPPITTVHVSAHGVVINWNKAIQISGGHVFRHRRLNYVTDTNRFVPYCRLVAFCVRAPEGWNGDYLSSKIYFIDPDINYIVTRECIIHFSLHVCQVFGDNVVSFSTFIYYCYMYEVPLAQ